MSFWKQKQNDFTRFTVLLDRFTVIVENTDWAFRMFQALLQEPYIYIYIYFNLFYPQKKKGPGNTSYYTHFKGQKTEAHRGQVTSLKLHSRSWYLNITLKPMLFDTLNCFWFLSVKVLDLWLILESVICQRHFSLFYSGCSNEPFDRIRTGHHSEISSHVLFRWCKQSAVCFTFLEQLVSNSAWCQVTLLIIQLKFIQCILN